MSTGFMNKLEPPHSFPFTITNINIFQASTYQPPLDISGCVCWLDGQDIFGNGTSPTDGANITSWYDKSGNGIQVTSYPGAAENVASEIIPPIYDASRKGIYFNGVNASLKTTLSASQNLESFFIVCDVQALLYADGTSRNNIILGSQERGRKFQIMNSAMYITGGNRGDGIEDVANAVFANTIRETIIVTSVKDSLKIRNYQDGNALRHYDINGILNDGSPAFSYGANCTTNISGYNTGDGITQTFNTFGGFHGYIYEIIVYNEPVNAQRRKQIEAYLAKKWNCNPKFPNTHPAKNQLNLVSSLDFSRATQIRFIKN